MASRFSQVQGGLQKRIQVDVLDRNLPAQWIGIGKPDGAATGNFSRGHGRTQFEVRRAPVGRQAAVETADDFLADPEIHDANGPLAERRHYRTTGFQLETDLPPYREARRLESLEILERQRCADKFCGYGLVRITIARRTGDDTCTASAFLPGREEAQLRIGNSRFVPRNTQLSPQAIEGKPVDFPIREIEKACQARILARAMPMKLARQLAAHRIRPADQLFDSFDWDFFEIGVCGPLVCGSKAPVRQGEISVERIQENSIVAHTLATHVPLKRGSSCESKDLAVPSDAARDRF